VNQLVSYTGGFAGLAIQYIIPAWMVFSARSLVERLRRGDGETESSLTSSLSADADADSGILQGRIERNHSSVVLTADLLEVVIFSLGWTDRHQQAIAAAIALQAFLIAEAGNGSGQIWSFTLCQGRCTGIRKQQPDAGGIPGALLQGGQQAQCHGKHTEPFETPFDRPSGVRAIPQRLLQSLEGLGFGSTQIGWQHQTFRWAGRPY
jgi:hypothetical protein